MNNFCKALEESIQREFNIDACVYVSKKKELVYLSLNRPLHSYLFFNKLIAFLKKYWNKRKYFL